MKKLNEEQQELSNQLKEYLINGSGFFGVYGAGGTGKTFTITETIKEDPKNIVFLGATNKVCKILKDGFAKVDKEYTIKTIDSFLNFKIKKDHNNISVYSRKLPLKDKIPKIIVIDECSMISNDSIQYLLKLKNYGVKVILIGDEMQIPPITTDDPRTIPRNEKGFKVSKIFDHIENTFTLTKQNRQNDKSDLFNLINGFRNHMDKRIPYDVMANKKQNGKDILYFDDYNSKEFRKELYGEDIITVAYKNLTCLSFNWLIGSTKTNNKGYKVSELNVNDKVFFDTYYRSNVRDGAAVVFYTSETITIVNKYEKDRREFEIDGHKVEYFVDELEVLDNTGKTHFIDVSRGQKETIQKIYYRLDKKRKRLKKQIEETTNEKYKWVLRKKIAEANTKYSDFRLSLAKLKKPYAITAHKAQGSTYDAVIIPVYDFYSKSPQDANQLFYVAMSRAKHKIIFVNKKTQFKNNSNRYNFTELERCSIASAQSWKCKGVILGYEYENGRKEIGCNKVFYEAREFEVDHIKRLEDGGSNNPTNLQTLCKECHKQKTLTEKV